MIFLIGLIFISKISFAFIPGFPDQLSIILFQHGMHPYINILLSCLLGALFIVQKFLNPEGFQAQSRFFRFYAVLGSLFLLFITLLQIIFQQGEESILMQLAAACVSIFMIYLYGRVISTRITPVKFLTTVKKICVVLCWLSLAALFISHGTAFKGGRFIGIFKHIPHMVSVATIGCIFLLYDFFSQPLTKKKKLLFVLSFLCCFLVLVLTGTRSALASVLMSVLLGLILFPAKSPASQFLKVSVAIGLIMTGVFFGDDAIEYAIEVARGERAVGQRAAQDGVASRMEEFERGYQIFQESPWLGHGLLSKFGNSAEAGDVSGYNANKDPHNVLVSAGVVGGWGMIFLTVAGLMALIVATFKKLLSPDPALKMLAIYMITQVPIIFIYHIHLSIGGIADRIYWIIFGYMALKINLLNRHQGHENFDKQNK